MNPFSRLSNPQKLGIFLKGLLLFAKAVWT